MKSCSFPNCKKKHCAKGYCSSHWAQMNRRGILSPIVTNESPEERFWRQVEKNEHGCWIWKGPKTGKFYTEGDGYGQIYHKQLKTQGQKMMAHRFSYALHGGHLPDHLQLDHLCRNKMCVNPSHLEPVTRSENINRMHAYHYLTKEIKRLKNLLINAGINPDADILNQ